MSCGLNCRLKHGGIMMFIKRNKICFIYVLLLLCFLPVLTACNRAVYNNPKNSTEEKTFEFNSFGEDAYNYVKYFQNNLNERIAGTTAEKKSADYLISVLKKAGYKDSQIEIQSFNSPTSQNIIVTKQGSNDRIIAVGAHYDSVNTHGIEDNASGVSVVLSTAIRQVHTTLPYTTKFIFFGAEEVGFAGSAYYVNSLTSNDIKKIGLMINIDSIMTGDKAYLYGGSVKEDGTIVDTWAVEKAKAMADKLSLKTYFRPDYYNNEQRIPSPVAKDSSDHASFKNIGIPYIYFASGNYDQVGQDKSMGNNTFKEVLHTPNDNLDILDKVLGKHMPQMLQTYSLLLHYLLLDKELIK